MYNILRPYFLSLMFPCLLFVCYFHFACQQVSLLSVRQSYHSFVRFVFVCLFIYSFFPSNEYIFAVCLFVCSFVRSFDGLYVRLFVSVCFCHIFLCFFCCKYYFCKNVFFSSLLVCCLLLVKKSLYEVKFLLYLMTLK